MVKKNNSGRIKEVKTYIYFYSILISILLIVGTISIIIVVKNDLNLNKRIEKHCEYINYDGLDYVYEDDQGNVKFRCYRYMMAGKDYEAKVYSQETQLG